jgi:hypothetical protein
MPKPVTKWSCNDCSHIYDNELRAIMCELDHKCTNAISKIEKRALSMYKITGNFSRVSERVIDMKNITEQLERLSDQFDKIDPITYGEVERSKKEHIKKLG